jgi:GTP cyclohydrolase II
LAIQFVESCRLPTRWGEFTLCGFEDSDSDKEHVALSMGDIANGEPVLARLHSECLTGDALHSERCDCGSQLEHSMEQIADQGRGVLLYLKQEGRGIGLLNKIKAYKLQDAGADTVEANEHLGFGADLRDYSICEAMLAHLGVKKLRLMTNNPKKIAALEVMGFEVVERLPISTGHTPHNKKYLETKQGKLGHLLEDSDTHR